MSLVYRFLFVVFFAVYGLLWIDVDWFNWTHESTVPSHVASLYSVVDDNFDECRLLDVPTWTPSLKKMLNPGYDPLKNCDRSFTPLTRLKKGLVEATTNVSSYQCVARALEPKSDYRYKEGPWLRLEQNHVFKNDIVEVKCYRTETNSTEYHFLHHQIWRDDFDEYDSILNSTTSSESDLYPKEVEFSISSPSVYVIVVDSIGASHARRVFPRTLDYLKRNFDAVDIQHVNKVGENSRPNGFAFLFGKMIAHRQMDMFGMDSIPAEWDYKQYCKTFLDNSTFILKSFEEIGYKTLMAEDWSKGVFNWPSCVGFEQQPATHYMRPFQIRFEKERPKLMREIMSKDRCFEDHKFLMEYLDSFIQVYPDKPKFGFVWATNLAHNSATNPFHADSYIEDFFNHNKEEFDNSFLFFMGDHGLRFGKITNDAVGKIDMNNPMLMISVPRNLRSNVDLMENLETNSKKLVTQFDTHATLVDILKNLALTPQFSPDFRETIIDADLKGSSLFRPLPPGKRNCKTLPIPVQFCLCEITKTPVKSNETLTVVGNVVANALNAKIEAKNISESCSEWKTSKVLSLLHIEGTKGLYEATTYLRDLNVEKEGSGHNFVNVVDITRTNSYGKQADCIEENEIRPICYCKDYKEPTAAPKAKKKKPGKTR